MLTLDSGSSTHPIPSGSPVGSLDPTQLIHSSPAVCPQSSSLHQQLSSQFLVLALQPITATLTSPYVIQQALFPPVTPRAHPVQPPVTGQRISALSPHAPSFTQPSSFVHLPHTGHSAYPGTELLFASAYGIPQPKLPVFESGNESDFALFKLVLDNLLSNHSYLSEQYKYHVLLRHLKHPSAQQQSKSYMYHPHPYSAALQALQDKYGQTQQLVQSELGSIMNSPSLKLGDANAFDSFALSIQSLVGMLRTLNNLRSVEILEPTMRNIYKTLTCQYDPLGFIIPFTTRAKVIIQDLWKHNLGWDDPIEPLPLREKWLAWVAELPTSSAAVLSSIHPSLCGQSFSHSRASCL
ncbi:uncharacterized protein LOC130427939 [Triplophysa dalaica]|uniref:uncharacterized protein LOC130427939 n=1 Tax=Triplophysa dalaica TaxID=1582913 RepID=UPI0024DF5255|nr:uncharacterized protein LOC130427939 [Triplophysa dalaica]XP_056611681.1 uncharacterized protein LOC130427939 [Triplophysa dalaica]